MRPVRELGDQIEQRGQDRDRRLVVVDRRLVLLAADRDRPQDAAENLPRCGSRAPGVEVEVVAVGAQNPGERVRRVPDLDLDPVETSLEESPEEIDSAQLATQRCPVGSAGRELELDQRLLLAPDQMMVVIAGQEHEPLSLELLADHDRTADRQR